MSLLKKLLSGGERERKRASFVGKRFNDVYAFFETHRLMCKNLNWFVYIFGLGMINNLGMINSIMLKILMFYHMNMEL